MEPYEDNKNKNNKDKLKELLRVNPKKEKNKKVNVPTCIGDGLGIQKSINI